ncbi:hypothetical protein B0H13DRAFT_2023452 [Mycena leptocephala]|nr:hypothetical protein B0H13DRAFT_2023452 [Mycena leptocephala]
MLFTLSLSVAVWCFRGLPRFSIKPKYTYSRNVKTRQGQSQRNAGSSDGKSKYDFDHFNFGAAKSLRSTTEVKKFRKTCIRLSRLDIVAA